MKIFNSLIVIVMFGVFAITPLVSAQEPPSSSGGLSISPTKHELVIDRGKADKIDIDIKNISPVKILAKAYLNDFISDGNTGNPKLIVDDSKVSQNSLREFVTGVEDVELGPGETKTVQVFIQIPEQAAPGAYYGAVRFIAEAPGTNENNAQVALNASVASLVLVEVPGDITERILVKDLSAYLNKNKGSLFTVKPNQVGVEIENQGNGFSKPFGRIKVNGPWGKGEVFSYELNDTVPRANVLPITTRLFLNDISGISVPGRYTIQANISHGNGGEILEVKSTFWYLPIWFLLIVLVVVLILVGIIYYLYRKYSSKSTKKRK